MALVSWSRFNELPGAATTNFERLCRAVVYRHYSRYGEFRYTKNQAGIEFSLLLLSDCELGEAGACFGWQCRWYDLPKGRAIGTTRRSKIIEALRISEATYPELTDWILCTRESLSTSDQTWFGALASRLKLHLWTNEEVEDLLNGPALPLRETYFGERILTPHSLAQLHDAALSPIKAKWIPEVHVEVESERAVNQLLFAPKEWVEVGQTAERLEKGLASLTASIKSLPESFNSELAQLTEHTRSGLAELMTASAVMSDGDIEALQAFRPEQPTRTTERALRRLKSRLRALNSPLAATVTNLTADLGLAIQLLGRLSETSSLPIVAIHGRAGQGKTELAIRVTQASDTRPAGVLLMGNRLKARESFDDLARTFVIHGVPCTSFESLVEALDAAAQRSRCRLPIVVDSLGEAERPNDWNSAIASATATLRRFPHVLLVVTLRTEFCDVCLPVGTPTLQLNGFEEDHAAAVEKYFAYFKIDAGDGVVVDEFIEHPLMLRMFCEVTNPTRKHVVGAAGMPASLTALFDHLLDQVARRVSEQTERPHKLHQHEVRAAMTLIGRVLWSEGKRFADLNTIRESIGDAGRDWDFSVIRLLESEGILIRHAHPGADNLVGFGYDMMAGHLIADALLRDQGSNLSAWLGQPSTNEKLLSRGSSAHPLGQDVFTALVGLAPRRLQGAQLWGAVPPESRRTALLASMELEVGQLDEATVAAIRGMILADQSSARRVFATLRRMRALPEHPLNADFIDSALRAMPNAERDLYWSEWLREREKEVRDDLEGTQRQFDLAISLSEADFLRARWACWALTSTVRPLRDQATRTLYAFGRKAPQELAKLVVESLTISDPYVPERLLCAAYGVALGAMSPLTPESKAFVVDLARQLVHLMFVPSAPHATAHVLTREYALGVITIARMLDAEVVDQSMTRLLRPPFAHLRSPFEELPEIDSAAIDAADRAAIHMDFGNYTMGRLVSGRQNYDMSHAEYVQVRRKIVARMVELGYSPAAYELADRDISAASWRHGRGERGKIERYGKKYSWIALLEMHGVQRDQGKVSEHRLDERCSEADLDPCFPQEHALWSPELKPVFVGSPGTAVEWLSSDCRPDYAQLLEMDEVDGQFGPWVMLDGYLSEASGSDDREIFTFVQGVFVSRPALASLLQEFDNVDYPGNRQIPAGAERHYTYLGEMPFEREELPLGIGQPAREEQSEAFNRYVAGSWRKGIDVLPSIQTYAWESYHSALNGGGGASLPNTTLCTALALRYQPGSFDLVDDAGTASIFRAIRRSQAGEEVLRGNVCYLRKDLLQRFALESGLIFVTFVWGERGFHHSSNLARADSLQPIYASHKHIHQYAKVWEP